MSLSNSANTASSAAIARPAGVVRSKGFGHRDESHTKMLEFLQELPAGPLPIGPNDPTATRALRRSHGGAPHPATSPAVAVARRRCRPLSLAGRWSNPAGRRIPAGRGSATGWSVDRWWTRGRRCRLGTFWSSQETSIRGAPSGPNGFTTYPPAVTHETGDAVEAPAPL